MNIERINIYKVSLPFTGDFSISRFKGISSNTVVVEVIANNGEIKGYGEGLPVEFVTGETPESVIKNISYFTQNDTFPWELNDVSQIWNFVDSLPNGKEANAAICASELALLDTLGKGQDKYLTKYFSKDFYTDTIFYGASITLGDKERIMELCRLIRNQGIYHLRIKFDNDFEQNKEAIEIVGLVFGDDCELRIDPNCVWDLDLSLKHMPLIKKYKVKVVEEPMVRDNPDFPELAKMVRANGLILMACESAPTLKDVERIIDEGHYQMVNVKLSRSGGFRRSLKIIDYLRTNGISFQIGCTIGESGILSSAGRVLGLLCSDAVYLDGSYDKFMLKDNITVDHVSFGPGGAAGPIDGPGLGVEINCQSLERLCDDSKSVTINRP